MNKGIKYFFLIPKVILKTLNFLRFFCKFHRVFCCNENGKNNTGDPTLDELDFETCTLNSLLYIFHPLHILLIGLAFTALWGIICLIINYTKRDFDKER